MDHKYPGLTSNLVEKSDVVVWLGDLNYRVELPRCAVQDLLKHKMQELWANDQLSIALQKGQVFHGFQEGPLLFPPTYKYDVGTDNYDTSSKERVPSWTDRILYKVNTVTAELRGYDAIGSMKTSDHRPVKAHLVFKSLL
jgi:endonuclease/exonuclease/phosphatase family metal-dependent hydrolase